MADRDRPDRRSHREILSDPKAISDYRRNKADSFREMSRDLTRSSPDSLAATYPAQPVHVARPTRSIIDFARNDKCELVSPAPLRAVVVDLIRSTRSPKCE